MNKPSNNQAFVHDPWLLLAAEQIRQSAALAPSPAAVTLQLSIGILLDIIELVERIEEERSTLYGIVKRLDESNTRSDSTEDDSVGFCVLCGGAFNHATDCPGVLAREFIQAQEITSQEAVDLLWQEVESWPDDDGYKKD